MADDETPESPEKKAEEPEAAEAAPAEEVPAEEALAEDAATEADEPPACRKSRRATATPACREP